MAAVAAAAPRAAGTSLVAFWIAVCLCQWHRREGPLAVWIEEHFEAFAACLGCFAAAAWWTVIREATGVAKRSPFVDERDRLWDIAKFGLIWCVLNYHMKAGLFNGRWYDSFMMPAFMIMNGLQQSPCGVVFAHKRWKRMFRDCIVNNYMFALVLTAIHQTSYDGTLWFLWALPVYRLIINPMMKGLILGLGDYIGSLVGVSCVGVLVWMVTWLPSEPMVAATDPLLIRVISASMHLRIGVTWIFEHAVFYALGLALNCNYVRCVLSKPLVVISALCYMAFNIYVALAEDLTVFGVRCGDFFPRGESLMRDADGFTFAADVLWRSLSAFAFIACCVPVADAWGAHWICQLHQLSKIAARCGSRTLYGYYLHQLLRFATGPSFGRLRDATSRHVHPHASLAMQGLLIGALCSPLSETCFSWLVSPQWMVDLAAEVVSPFRRWLCNLCAAGLDVEDGNDWDDAELPMKRKHSDREPQMGAYDAEWPTPTPTLPTLLRAGWRRLSVHHAGTTPPRAPKAAQAGCLFTFTSQGIHEFELDGKVRPETLGCTSVGP
jgi:fucose 4-O-acetylase-like acetyltransferase